MKRIAVDFNTLNSTPLDLVKIAETGSPREQDLQPLHAGERVILWEPGLVVEATLLLYDGSYWMAQPDEATWHDLPLSPAEEAELAQFSQFSQ